MGAAAIEKVYDLKALGGQKTYDDLERINKMFIEIRKNKVNLNNQASKIEDPAKLQEITDKLNALKIQEKELLVEMKKKQLQAKEQALLEQEQIRQTKESSAAKKKALSDEKQTLTELQIEEKKLQIQRKQEQVEAKQGVGTNEALAGSYNDIAKQYRSLLAISKNITNLNNPQEIRAASEELMKFKSRLDNFNRSLTQDKLLIGEYTTGIMNAFKKMGMGNMITDQVNTAKASLSTLNTEFQVLANELSEIRVTGQGSLETVQRMLVENRQAASQLETELNRVQTELKNTGSVGSQITSAIGKEFKNLKQQFVGFVAGYFGFQMLISGIHKTVAENYELADSFSDIQIRIKGTDEEVEKLFDSLKKIDTRTSLAGLVDIASTVSKKGVAKEEIAGITQAIDSLLVVLGKEIGDPHEAVASLVKLTNVYSEDKHVTADNINMIGGAIAKLTQSGVATGGFLIDFAERMAGIRGITGLTIDKVLGMGAAMEELGQRTETSATAMSQLVVKLFTDTERYADIAGMSLTEFKNLLSKDVMGAFVLVANKLKGNAGEMEHFFEGVEDMHTKGARVVGVLGDIAANADYARKRMNDATAALQQHGLVAQSAAVKQHNLAAEMDRIKKAFETISTEKSVRNTLGAIVGAVEVLIKSLPVLIKLSYALLIVWTALNAELILTKIQLGIINIVARAYAIGLGLMTGATNAAAAATAFFNTVVKGSPLGIILTIIGLVAAGFTTMAYAIGGSTKELKLHAQALLMDHDIQAKANEATADSVAKVKLLTSVIKDNTASLDIRKKALADLIAISPDYLRVLTLENIRTAEGAKIIDEYVTALKKKAALQAAINLQSDAIKRDQELQLQEYDLQKKVASGETEGLFEATYEFQLLGVKRKRAIIAKELGAIDELLKEKYKDQALDKSPDGISAPEAKARTIADIEKDIKNTIRLLKHAIEGTKEAKDLAAILKGLRAELKEALGKNGMGHGSKLSIEESEAFKLINAQRDNKITALKTAYAEEDAIRKYYNSLFINNERVYLEQLQKIEEAAINKKIALIKGSKPAEIQTRAKLHLELLDSQREYNNKFYKMDLDKLNAERENNTTGAKDLLDAIENNATSTDLEKSIAKLNYYNSLKSQYIQFMTAMDALEKKYNKVSEKNMADRKHALEQLQNNTGRSLIEIQKESNDNEYAELKNQYEKEARQLLINKIKATKNIISDGSLTPGGKKEALEDVGRASDLNLLNAGDKLITKELELNQFLYDHKLITSKEYYAKLDELQQRNLENAMRRYSLEDEEDNKHRQLISKGIEGAFTVAQAVEGEYFNMLSKKEELNDAAQKKEMDWNKKQYDSQVQSNKDKIASDKAYAIAQEDIEKQKRAKDKQRAMQQMGIEYALSAMKIVANNIYKGPEGWAQAAIEEGILSATYATKLAFMSQYEQGGEVPGGGGEFGGTSHSDRGTPFIFRGRMFEAEAKELAIINKKSASSNEQISISGTPRQIASGINAYGGGRNFAPGARMHRFEYGGLLGGQITPPSFINRYYHRKARGTSGGDEQMNAIYNMVLANSEATRSLTDHVHKIQVHVSANEITKCQNKHTKSTQVGTI